MTDQTIIPDLSAAADAPAAVLMLATFSRGQRQQMAGQSDLLRQLRNSDPLEWNEIIEGYRAPRRAVHREACTNDPSGMRRQALHDLHEAAHAYTKLTDGRRCELFRWACRLAKYVANRVLQPSELRDAFQGAADQNGAFARYGQRWLDDTIARALEAGRDDDLPPLARRFRSGSKG